VTPACCVLRSCRTIPSLIAYVCQDSCTPKCIYASVTRPGASNRQCLGEVARPVTSQACTVRRRDEDDKVRLKELKAAKKAAKKAQRRAASEAGVQGVQLGGSKDKERNDVAAHAVKRPTPTSVPQAACKRRKLQPLSLKEQEALVMAQIAAAR
jgi:hypothetical protein